MRADKLKEYRPAGAEYGYETVENIYQLDHDHEFCPICNQVNTARSYDVGLCQHFVGKYGEGEIGDNLGVFSDFEEKWDGLLTWCQENVDELGDSQFEELVSEACEKLKMPPTVASLLTNYDQFDAVSAFRELFDLKQGKDMDIFFNLYSENPDHVLELTESLSKMLQLLRGEKPDDHRNRKSDDDESEF